MLCECSFAFLEEIWTFTDSPTFFGPDSTSLHGIDFLKISG